MHKQHKKDQKPNGTKTLYAFTYISQIGLTIVASILVGVLMGKLLDHLLGTQPIMLLVFSMLGVGASIKSLFDLSGEK